MSEPRKAVSLFSGTRTGAQYDAAEIYAKLQAAGLAAEIEVTVPAEAEAEARAVLAGDPPMGDVDPTSDLDWETIAVFHGIDGEIQAAAVKSLLETSGIDVTVIEAAGFPSLPFRIRVARKMAEEARNLLAQAESIGAQAAEQEFDK